MSLRITLEAEGGTQFPDAAVQAARVAGILGVDVWFDFNDRRVCVRNGLVTQVEADNAWSKATMVARDEPGGYVLAVTPNMMVTRRRP